MPKSRSSSIQPSNAPGHARGEQPGARARARARAPRKRSIVAAAGATPWPQRTSGSPRSARPEDDRQVAAGAVQVRLDDLQREAGRDRGVERVAAALEHRHAGRGREPVRRRDHAEGAAQLGPGRERQRSPLRQLGGRSASRGARVRAGRGGRRRGGRRRRRRRARGSSSVDRGADCGSSGQRVRKRQPDGGSSGLGDVALEHDAACASRCTTGSGTTAAESSACVYGCCGAREELRASAPTRRSCRGTSPRRGRRGTRPSRGRGVMNRHEKPRSLLQVAQQVEDRRLHRDVERRHRLVGDQQRSARAISARARPTRWRWPPESSCG